LFSNDFERPIRILLAEDNPADVRLAREALRETAIPHEFHTVADGQETVDFLYRHGRHAAAPAPDLILLDLNLPRKNGHDVLREIKSKPSLRRIPVVIFSSSLSERDVKTAYDLHANCFIRKPADLDEIFRVMRGILVFWGQVARVPGRTVDGDDVAADQGRMPAAEA
jgi:two-component system, chemotaxis family, response regulator Rcp1